MKKVTTTQALNQAYKNLYDSELDKIDKNLDALMKAKKFASKKKN